MNIPPKYEDVVAQLEAALGREAALREELARYQSLFAQAQKAIDRLNELHPKRMSELAKRLTVAERRADEMAHALTVADEYLCAAESLLDRGEDDSFNLEPAIITVRDALKAALKPAAEGGGS